MLGQCWWQKNNDSLPYGHNSEFLSWVKNTCNSKWKLVVLFFISYFEVWRFEKHWRDIWTKIPRLGMSSRTSTEPPQATLCTAKLVFWNRQSVYIGGTIGLPTAVPVLKISVLDGVCIWHLWLVFNVNSSAVYVSRWWTCVEDGNNEKVKAVTSANPQQ